MKSIVFEWKQKGSRQAYEQRTHKTRLVIGSMESADIRLESEEVAPIHAVLEFDGDSAQLFDLGSATGVQVNGKKVVTRQVQEGDKIQIGPFELTFGWGKKNFVPERAQEDLVQGMEAEAQEIALILEDVTHVEEIFDYRAAQRGRALEVVTSWSDLILDVQHHVRRRKIPFGSSVAVATGKGLESEYQLELGSGVRGVHFHEGRLEAVTRGPLRVVNGDYVKLREGDVETYLSFSDPPPRLKKKRKFERDPFFFKILLTSLALTVLMVTALRNISVPTPIEAEQLPERIVKILYSPEQFKNKTTTVTEVRRETEKIVKSAEKTATKKVTLDLNQNRPKVDLKKPLPKEMNVAAQTAPKQQSTQAASTGQRKAETRSQREAREGEGARAKGREGRRGKPDAPKDDVAQTRARPGFSRVQGAGNVDALQGAEATIKDLLTGSTAQFGKGGTKLQGTGGFDTEGDGGLALSGQGRGGGGKSNSFGLGTQGVGAGRIGTGLGAAGDGKGIVGGKSRVAVRGGGAEETVIMGSIDPDLVEAALLAHKDEFRLCYEREVNAGFPDLQGQIATTFVIGSSGRVTTAGVASSSLKNPNVERCVLDVIRRIDFPIPRGAGLVQVNKSFRFRPTGGGR